MGDCGSLFLGYSLGVLSLMDLKGRPLVSFSIIAFPLFALAVPVFDTTLVTVLRTSTAARSRGGPRSLQPSLVSLGLSGAGRLHALGHGGGGGSSFPGSAPISGLDRDRDPPGRTLVVYYFGAYLGSVEVYRSDPNALDRARFRGFFVFDTFIAHKRMLADVGVDTLVICLSYLTAFLLRYEHSISPINATLIIRSLPFLLGTRLLCAFAFGLYRAVPGAFSIHGFLAVAKTVIVSSALFATGSC